MADIGIIGTGNVGLHLIREFCATGLYSLEVYSRNTGKTSEIATEFKLILREKIGTIEAPIVFVCVPDHAILDVIKEIPISKRVIVTGGAIDLNSIEKPLKGIFYPMQTFSSNCELTNKDYPIFIEGSTPEIYTELTNIGKSIGKACYPSTYEERISYHLTAVWVNNFTNHLLYQAKELAEANKLNWELFFPLLDETIAKMKAIDPFEAQTGPAKRMDEMTIQHHIEMLENKQLEIYQLLTTSISKTYNG